MLNRIIVVFITLVGACSYFTCELSHQLLEEKKGIHFQNRHGGLYFFSHEDSSEKFKLDFGPDIILENRSIVRNSMNSLQHADLIEEHSFKCQLIHEDLGIKLDVRITARFFHNADTLLLMRFFSTQDMPSSISLNLNFPIRFAEDAKMWSLQYDSLIRPSEMVAPESSMDKISLRDRPMRYPATLHYIETYSAYEKVNGSLLLGPGAVFRNKDIRLRELQSSEIFPLINLDKENQWLHVSIPIHLEAYQYQENWMMYSFGQLLDYSVPETMQNMLSADFNLRKKLSFDGIYHYASHEFYVGAEEHTYDYYYNYAMWEGRRFMDLHRMHPHQRFFYNFFLNSVFTTTKAVHRYGVWVSDVRSKYLWNEYQIREGFIDTRYSTDAGFFLLRAYNEFQIPYALSAAERIGNFLHQKMIEKDGIITGEKGFLFFDYYVPDEAFITHGSLNHNLSVMNYLFELYISTHRQHYLTTAETMLTGLHETVDRWIRDQEWGRWRYDLWYAVFPQADGALKFDLHDYTKDLTYYDLLITKNHIKTIYNRKDNAIERMIESKLKWFAREGIEVGR